MYEYSIESFEITAKLSKQKLNETELDGLLELINRKAEDGWELVTNTFIPLTPTSWSAYQSFVCTFRRKK